MPFLQEDSLASHSLVCDAPHSAVGGKRIVVALYHRISATGQHHLRTSTSTDDVARITTFTANTAFASSTSATAIITSATSVPAAIITVTTAAAHPATGIAAIATAAAVAITVTVGACAGEELL